MPEKLGEVRKKLVAIQSTVKGSALQVNKDRRINSLVEMALALIAEIEEEEVCNG